jgi:hypothetical protein
MGSWTRIDFMGYEEGDAGHVAVSQASVKGFSEEIVATLEIPGSADSGTGGIPSLNGLLPQTKNSAGDIGAERRWYSGSDD